MKNVKLFCLVCLRRTSILVMAFVSSVILMNFSAYALGNTAISSPQSNQVIGSTLNVRWKAVRGAKSYQVCVREAGTSQCLVRKVATGSSTRFRVSSTMNALKGKKISVYVTACETRNGGSCSRWSRVDAWLMGAPVSVSAPANAATYSGTDRRPTFSWQSYAGISGSGNMTYTLRVWGNGASLQEFPNITSTSYRPSIAIKPAFQNPVRWSVTAYKGGNRSASSRARKLTLAASSFATVSAPNLRSPSNGVTVDTGTQLRWYAVSGAGSYKVCLGLSSNGCNITRTVNASTTSYTLTNRDLQMFRNKRMYWAVQAVATGGTSVAGSARRFVQVASGASSVSFSALANTYKHARCINCHNFMNSGNSSAAGTLGKHLAQSRFTQAVRPTNPGNTCNSCHQNQSGGEWKAPIAAHSFTNKSNTELCALTKALGSASAVRHHLKQDPRILWAISPATGPVASPTGKAPPGNISQWNTLVDNWVDGGMRCQ